MRETLFIFDGTALAYRAHFAFINNPLINSKGQHTSALYGVINSFLKIYEQHKPQYVAISFDKREPTFRHTISTDYKANRPPMPDELASQIDAIGEFFRLAGVKEVSQSGFEADDMIGSLARKFSDELNVVIVSKDKDFAQLVNDNVLLYDLKAEKFLTDSDIITKFEVSPAQFIDYLALVGDSSDNIPGAKGIGPKTATKLLAEYKTLDNIYQNLDSIKEKAKLAASKDDVYLSKTLATIKTNLPLDDVDLGALSFDINRLQNVLSFLESYELRSLAKKIGSYRNLFSEVDTQSFLPLTEPQSSQSNDTDKLCNLCGAVRENDAFYQQENYVHNGLLITSLDHLKTVLATCTSDVVAIDTETTSTDSLSAQLVGISLCFTNISPPFVRGEGGGTPTTELRSLYIPIAHTFAENIDYKEVISHLKNFITNKIIVGHNLKYDMQVLERYGFNIENLTPCPFDTMLAAYLLDPGKNEYSLSACAKRELNYEMIPISDLIGKGKKQLSFADVDVEKACRYSAEDAWVTYRLYELYHQRLINQNLYDLYTNVEIPLICTLSYMEKQGVHIDTAVLNKINSEVTEQIDDLIKKIYTEAGEAFNINSPQQLSGILFEKLKLDPVKKIKTGFSTDIEVLETLAENHQIARLLIEYRHLTKMKNTYIEALPLLVNPATKRVHSSFNQTITSTGRLSSTNPNLQNIPIKTDLGKKIRQAFTASEGHYIVAADYSQIELRLLAILSDDESMKNAFRKGLDIHTNTAEKIFRKVTPPLPPPDGAGGATVAPSTEAGASATAPTTTERVGGGRGGVTPAERRKAKVINFGIIYGMGANSLAKELGISHSEAKTFISDYFANFPTIKAYIDKQKFDAHQNGFVSTIYGRKLFLTDINSSNQRIASEAERIAVNMPIQGSAADIIKIAMNNIYQKIKHRHDIKMLIQVHDELVFEVTQQSLFEACSIIKDEMENALLDEYRKKVPLVVDIGYGYSWAEAH